MLDKKKLIKAIPVIAIMVLLASVFVMPENTYAESKIHLQKVTVNITYGTTYQQKLIDKSGKAVKATSVTWKSNNRGVAKINRKGKVTTVKVGSAKLTATYKGKTYTFTVNVKNPTLKVKNKIMKCGESFNVKLCGVNGIAISASNIKFSSGNSKVAIVSKKGQVKAKKTGSAIIKLKYKGKTFKCNVAVVHNEKVLPGYQAGCTAEGLTEGVQCSGCDELIVAQETIPATGHIETIDVAVEPTCAETGLTEGKHCSACDETFIAQEVIPAKGHEWKEATCTEPKICKVCNVTEGNANGHDWKKVWATNRDYLGSEVFRVCKTCHCLDMYTIGDVEFAINDTMPEGNGEKVKVILLGGQSNASGCSWDEYLKQNVSAEKYAEYDNGYDNVFINYYVSGTIESNGFTNCRTRQGENGVAFGPELGLAEKLHELYPAEKFFIIKYAWGGTNLYSQWLSPTSSGKTGVLYNQFVKYIDLSIQYLVSKNYDVEIEGMCWMQGESDSYPKENAVNYKVHLSNFIMDIRNQYANYASLDGIAFIDATIAANPDYWVYYQIVNQCKQEVANESYMNALIDTNAQGLTCSQEPYDQPDLAHYDSLSQIKLGNLFGQELSNYID